MSSQLRLVSLVPSVTETLLAWGVPPIAVTRFCEQPGMRTVGGTKDPDVGAIVSLAPSLVVMCDEENRAEDADALQAAGLECHVMTIRTVAQVAEQFGELAERLELDPPPIEIHPPASPTDGSRRRAFVPIWRRPWMTLNRDTYGSAVLAHIGVDNVYADADERYPATTLDEASARRPDIVVAPSEPYPFSQRHEAGLRTVAPVVFTDGRDLFWWGVRTPEAVRRLRAALNAGQA